MVQMAALFVEKEIEMRFNRSSKSRQTNDSHSQRSRAQKKPSGTFDKRRNKNSSNGRDRHNNVRNSRNSSRR